MRVATLDIETLPMADRPNYPPPVVGVAAILPGQRPQYLAFGHPTKNNATKAQAARLIREAYACDRVDLHNANYDLEAIQKDFGIAPPPWQKVGDTTFLLFLHDPRIEHVGLKSAAEDILDLPPTERDEVIDWLLTHQPVAGKRLTDAPKGANYAGGYVAFAPGDLTGRYAIGDVVRTRKLEVFLRADITKRGMLPAYERERELRPILLASECHGVPVDMRRLEADIDEAAGVQARLDDWLRAHLRAPSLNLNSGQQLAEVLLRRRVVHKLPRTEAGAYKTDRETLDAHITDRRLLAVFRHRSQLKTCVSTFMKPWHARAKANKGRIFTSWYQVRDVDGGARTGRISSSPNFQNIPKTFVPLFREHDDARKSKLPPAPWADLPRVPNMRRYILPERGHILIDRDYSQQEARILAHFDGGGLAARYNADPWIDFHDFAQQELARAGRKYERRVVKNTNFGLIYGMGVGKLAQKNDITVEEAKALKAAVLSLYPGLAHMYEVMRQRAKARLPIRTWGGRRYLCEEPELVNGRWRSYDYKLVNVLIQGSAADCTKQAIINWHAAAKPEWKLMINVHDELVCSVPTRDAPAAMLVLREAMESVRFDVPMLTEGATGANWGDMISTDEKGVPA